MEPAPSSHHCLGQGKILGYIAMDEATCSRCFAPIIWYRTPKRKLMPMNRVSLTTHWSTCPFAKEFKRKKK